MAIFHDVPLFQGFRRSCSRFASGFARSRADTRIPVDSERRPKITASTLRGQLEKLRLVHTIFDREVSLLQMGLGLTSSVRKQSQLAKEIAHGAKRIDLCDAQIVALEAHLQEES